MSDGFKQLSAVMAVRKARGLAVFETAQQLHDSKIRVPHRKVSHGDCPLENPRSVPEGCLSCDFTDTIGRCCFPVNIMEGIKDGRLLPWEEGDDAE